MNVSYFISLFLSKEEIFDIINIKESINILEQAGNIARDFGLSFSLRLRSVGPTVLSPIPP